MYAWHSTTLFLAAGWLLYLCMRIAHQWRISQPVKNTAAFAMKVLAHPFLLLFMFQVATGLRESEAVPFWVSALGLGIFFSGIGTIYAGHRELGLNYEAAIALKNPAALVTTGPYAIVRHPIYLGAILMGAGTEIALASPYMLVIFLLMPLVIWQIRREEALLSSAFGDAWLT